MDAPRTITITAADLMIGRTVNIFNRPLLLYDCDEYTENYYRTAYGITEFFHVKLPELINIAPESPIPHWDRLETEENTMEPDQLVQLPMLPGYPTEVNLDRSIAEVKKKIEIEIERFCEENYQIDDE
ncbi:MAG: hypothetical protein EZS28_031412 [Streblomastix strix]|uniref:DM10 domain-containing protein n=1 Tax=Streblomastix strix TaxID=222440 RepID=A0A5J4USL4_9EUKA|nr:MAG: hypothetical protein EZS28_031412 [Streblomastix strix]